MKSLTLQGLAMALIALALAGCRVPENGAMQKTEPDRWSREMFAGHTYILRWGGRSQAMAHDPDCPCRTPSDSKKEGE